MKFSALVLSLTLSSGAVAFAPPPATTTRMAKTTTSTTYHQPRFASPVETTEQAAAAAAMEQEQQGKQDQVMESSTTTTTTAAAASVPVDLPVETKKEEEEEEKAAPAAAAAVSVPPPSVINDEKSNNNEKVDKILPGRYGPNDRSIALPMLLRPNNLDGSHAGDFGFDPLGFSESLDLYTMQESELRHGRLAMLAVIGWPIAELIGPSWLLQDGGRVPSILNGFSPITFLATVAIFSGLGYFEYKTSLRSTYNTSSGRQHRADMSEIWDMGVAGDYNWDPLHWYSSLLGDSAIARKGLREVEISHGRSAMIGITTFVIWEALTGHAIVENSMFFHPNLLLPILIAGYVSFNAIYKIENNERYVFQISTKSEGEAILENLKLSMPTPADNEKTMKNLQGVAETAKNLINKAKDAYDKLSDGYVEYSTSNIKKNDD
eukprot:scaffold9841_cov102-Cylindrotheca_fusiformis.AAC.2